MKLMTEQAPWPGKRPLVLALGMFDGVHRAHAALIRRAASIARHRQGDALVYTFQEHPLEVLCPAHAPKRLQPLAARVRAIAALEPTALVLRRFDRAYAAQPPEAFVEALTAAYHPTDLVVGYNYSFGREGAGTPALLERLASQHSFAVHVLPSYVVGGAPLSSTRIRQALEAGDVEHAERLLGRPYTLYGRMLKNGMLHCGAAYVRPQSGAYRVRANGLDARLVVDGEMRLWGVEDGITPGEPVRALLLGRA